MIIVCSANGSVGIEEAMAVLRGGGSAVDAVECGIRRAEANAADHSVGLGGYPNLLGQVELDAGIMDGRDLTSGAVGALQGTVHAISVARQVMERLPHVLLAGEGAARFAREMGFEAVELLAGEARQVWERGLRAVMDDAQLEALPDLPDLWRWVELATDPERARGTVNFLALDAQGHLAAGASTSGWAWKYPGRLGDSPIAGAGFYADSRAGAAACTGMGEMAIRAGTALGLVRALRQGVSLAEAGRRAIAELNDLGGRYRSSMNVIALDARGQHGGWSSEPGRTYLVLRGDMGEPEEHPRQVVPIEKHWG